MTPIVDPEDEWLLRYRSWTPQKTKTGAVYFKARIDGKQVYLHRIIAGAGPRELADHKDGDTLNNRRGNLRACTRSQSNANRRRRSDSRAPYRGITQTPTGRWLAQIMAEKKFTRIGLFDTPEAAAAAYDKKALELHGEFARINNIAC